MNDIGKLADAIYDNLAAADNGDIPLEEYPQRIFEVISSQGYSLVKYDDVAARELYEKYSSNHPTIHCNRFPAWSELSDKGKEKYRLTTLQPSGNVCQGLTDEQLVGMFKAMFRHVQCRPNIEGAIINTRAHEYCDEDMATAARAYLAALPAAGDGWRPIESAPRDGNEILLGIAEPNGAVCAGFWHDGSECYGHQGGAGWFSEDDRCNLLTASNWHPTHWQPLPLPPQPKENEHV